MNNRREFLKKIGVASLVSAPLISSQKAFSRSGFTKKRFNLKS